MPLLRDGQREQQKKSKKKSKKREPYNNGEQKPIEISARLRDKNENVKDIHTNSFFLHHDNFLPLSRDGQRKKTQENGKKIANTKR